MSTTITGYPSVAAVVATAVAPWSPFGATVSVPRSADEAAAALRSGALSDAGYRRSIGLAS